MTKKRRKELKRVREFIRRAEKRGYIFPEEIKAGLTSKTTRALQYLTPRKLYESAEFLLGTVTVPGMRGRAIERERAAVKGALTRASRKKEVALLPMLNDLVYQNVIDLINTYPSSQAADYLRNLLNSEISQYGLDRVIAGMNAMDEDFVKRAEEILFYEGDSMRIHDALKSFADTIIAGVRRTKDEAIAFNEVSETL